MTKETAFRQFQQLVYQSIKRRKDTGLECINALSSATLVESPVAVSESPLFSRRFSSVYDWLKAGEFSDAQLSETLYKTQPSDAMQIDGYEVYAVDCTEDEHPDGKTFADRHQCRKGRGAPLTIGHRYSWLVRLLSPRTSWCYPQQVTRVQTSQTDSEVAADQIAGLDKQSSNWKVVVADSLYSNVTLLNLLLVVKTVILLVRLRTNRVLYEEPPARQPNQLGRPRKHGEKFKVSDPQRVADRSETATVWGQTVRLQMWHHLHFRQVAALIGSVVWVEFLKADGSPRFKRPLILFWSGPQDTPLTSICLMYLWRFAIEHMFRFLKQHVGLNTHQLPHHHIQMMWMTSCALAMCQLALLRSLVADKRRPWRPAVRNGQSLPMTPRQVQRAALVFLLDFDSPVQSPKPSGKGAGRPLGFSPEPRPRFAVVKKGKKAKKRS